MVDDGNQRFRSRNVLVENACSALIKDGPLGSLENCVVGWVAFIELVLNFFEKVVLFVFCFPIAMWEVVEIDERPVNDDGRTSGALDAVFGDQRELGIGPLAALS